MIKEAGGFSSLPSAVQKGFRSAMASEKPLLLAPLSWAVSKAVGKKKVDDFFFKVLQKPILSTDIALGSAAQKGLNKLTGSKKGTFFMDRKLLPSKRGVGSATGKVEYEVPSIMAPVSKTLQFAVPVAGTMKLQEIYEKSRKGGNEK